MGRDLRGTKSRYGVRSLRDFQPPGTRSVAVFAGENPSTFNSRRSSIVKQVVIVGGGGGLGAAIVKKLLDDGGKVVVAGRTRPVDQRIRHFYSIDATKIDWQSFYLTIENETAMPIHAVIFVAGTAVFGKTTLIPAESARQTFELNFWACATAAKAIAQHWE